jgi:PAS domain-containing protein
VSQEREQGSAKEVMRSRAERLASLIRPDEKYSGARVQDLIQELTIHQAEFEIQNEEFRAVQVELAQSKDRYFDLYDSAPIGYLTLDAHSAITEINLTGAGMLGKERRQLMKRVFWKYIAAEDRQRYNDHIEKARDTVYRCIGGQVLLFATYHSSG